MIGIPNTPFQKVFKLLKDLPHGVVGQRMTSGERVNRNTGLYKLQEEEKRSESNILSGIIEMKLFKMLFDRSNPNPLIKFNEFIKGVFSNPKKAPSLEQINHTLDSYTEKVRFNLDERLFESIVRLNRAILQLSILEQMHKI